MLHLAEIALLVLTSLWLTEGLDYEVLRNNSGQCHFEWWLFLLLVLVRLWLWYSSCSHSYTYWNFLVTVITALHGMQTRSNDDNSVGRTVCPSVRLSVKRVFCDKMEERSLQILILYERTFSPVFWEKEWLVGVTPSAWNFWSTGPR